MSSLSAPGGSVELNSIASSTPSPSKVPDRICSVSLQRVWRPTDHCSHCNIVCVLTVLSHWLQPDFYFLLLPFDTQLFKSTTLLKMALALCECSLITQLEPSLRDDLTVSTLICCSCYVLPIDLSISNSGGENQVFVCVLVFQIAAGRGLWVGGR